MRVFQYFFGRSILPRRCIRVSRRVHLRRSVQRLLGNCVLSCRRFTPPLHFAPLSLIRIDIHVCVCVCEFAVDTWAVYPFGRRGWITTTSSFFFYCFRFATFLFSFLFLFFTFLISFGRVIVTGTGGWVAKQTAFYCRRCRWLWCCLVYSTRGIPRRGDST